MIRLLQAANNVWRKLSRREQLLAASVFGLGVLMTVMFTYRSAMTRLDDQDDAIGRMQQDLVNYTYQIALKQSVEEEYAKVAAQHSSQWSEAEIHDRLRQELYRLAQKMPPELDENGVPMRTTSEGGELIKIPALQQGTLRETGEGYREYTISLNIPSVDIGSLITFLQRLQNSPQSLRIDALDINRNPLEKLVRADVDITRVITAGAPGSESKEKESPKSIVATTLNPAEWTCLGGNVTAATGEGDVEALVGESTEEAMDLSLLRTLESGKTYDLTCVVETMAEGQIKIGTLEGKAFPETESLRADGKAYRYQLRFTAPRASGARTRVQTPFIHIVGKGTKVIVSDLSLQKISE